MTIIGEYFSFLFWIYLGWFHINPTPPSAFPGRRSEARRNGWLFLLISKWFRVRVPASNEHQKTKCYSQAEVFCKQTASATLPSPCLWVLPVGKTNDAAAQNVDPSTLVSVVNVRSWVVPFVVLMAKALLSSDCSIGSSG